MGYGIGWYCSSDVSQCRSDNTFGNIVYYKLEKFWFGASSPTLLSAGCVMNHLDKFTETWEVFLSAAKNSSNVSAKTFKNALHDI